MLRISEVVAQEAGTTHPGRRAVGPELRRSKSRRQLPTAVLVASDNANAIELVQENSAARPSGSTGATDVIGVEIGGALKNIIAIAAGVGRGSGLGHNALAACITRGLAELTRLALRGRGGARRSPGLRRARRLSCSRCTGNLSRNRHVGLRSWRVAAALLGHSSRG